MMMPVAKNTSEVLKLYLMAVTLTVSNTSNGGCYSEQPKESNAKSNSCFGERLAGEGRLTSDTKLE